MNHKDKNKGTRRQKTGALFVIPIFFNLYLFAWEAKRVGGRGEAPCARCGSRAAPRRSLAEALELALALLHKLLGGPQLVAHDAQQLLRLLQEIEIDQVHLYHLGAVALLHAVEVLLAHERQVVLAAVGLGQRGAVVGVLSCGDLLVGGAHQFVDPAAYRLILRLVGLRERVEVVVDVLLDGGEHAAQRVDVLLVAVDADVEPRVALDGQVHRRSAQAQHLLAAILLQQVQFAAHALLALPQRPHVLRGKSLDDAVVLLHDILADRALRVAHVAAQHLPDQFRVARAHHQAESVVLLLGLGALRLVLAVAAVEQEDHERHEATLHDDAAKPHGEADQGAGDEGHTRRDKPAADDAQHARDAEDGALAAPGAVGQARTHGHHEGDVGRGEGQLVVGAEGDEHGGDDQVDGGTHHVEGGLVVLELHLVGVEARAHPAAQAGGEEALAALDQVLGAADDGAGGAARTKHLVALVLAGEIDGGLNDVLRLLRGGHGEDHHQARQDQVEGRRRGALHERGHHEGVDGLAVGVGREVLVGVEAGQRHADEVDEVVAGKGHGEAKRAHEDGKLEDVDAEQVERLHRDGRDEEGAEQQPVGVVLDVVAHVLGQVGALAHALHEDEVGEGREGDAAEDGDAIAAVLRIVEGEDDAAQPHHHHTDDKGDGHRDEDGDDHLQGLVRVEQVGVFQRGVAHHLEQREHRRAAQQLEDERDRGGGGHAERVESVEHDDVRHHHGQHDGHHLVEGIVGRHHDAVAGHVHHARGHHGAEHHAHRGNDEDGAKRRHAGADGRLQEVDRIVAHADKQVEDGQAEQEDDDTQINGLHVL